MAQFYSRIYYQSTQYRYFESKETCSIFMHNLYERITLAIDYQMHNNLLNYFKRDSYRETIRFKERDYRYSTNKQLLQYVTVM